MLAIALTTVLFTSLFTIAMSINDGIQQNNFRQVGGFSHGGFKYLTEEQFHELKDDPLIDQWGLRRFVGMPSEVPFNKSHVEVGYSDANEAHWMYCDPVEGRLPQEGTDEAATDTHVLELMGVTPEIGAKFTLTFDVDGHDDHPDFHPVRLVGVRRGHCGQPHSDPGEPGGRHPDGDRRGARADHGRHDRDL